MNADEQRSDEANWADDFDELSRQPIEHSLQKTFGASIWSRSSRAGLAAKRPERLIRHEDDR